MGNRQDREHNRPYTQSGETIQDSKTAREQGRANKRAHQKGPQAHAEGQHGEKTHRAFIESLHAKPPEEPESERIARMRDPETHRGRHRLVEDREQHAEPEKNSERNRLMKDRERGRGHGPSDNIGNLHGFQGSDRRADYQPRDEAGFRDTEDGV